MDPKATTHIQPKKRDPLVHIYAWQKQSQACKQCLVSDALLRAQNYYGGQRHIWIPKASLQSQIPWEKPKLVQARIPPISQVWRPKTALCLKTTLAPPSRQTMQWIPKCPIVNDANTQRYPYNGNQSSHSTSDSTLDTSITSALLTEEFQQVKNFFNPLLSLFKLRYD